MTQGLCEADVTVMELARRIGAALLHEFRQEVLPIASHDSDHWCARLIKPMMLLISISLVT
jgi:hypothetical protein